MATRLPQRSAGFTMVELLIAMVLSMVVMGAAYSMFRAQNTSFRTNSDRYDMVQNGRGALEEAERVIRTMGAGTPNNQPVLVYGAGTVLAFNTDYVEQDTVDTRWAAYFNPDVPVSETVAWDAAAAAAIPNSSPAYTYPATTYQLGNGSTSPAETYMFYFSADASTTRSDDYILYQRVNDGPAEIVARNILAHPSGRPFFEYLLQRALSTGDTLITATGSLLPLVRRPLVAGISSSDSADYTRPDSVRAVRMNFRLTNGKTGTQERVRDMTTTMEVPNNGIPLPTVCGRAPLPPASITAVESPANSKRVVLTWPKSVDQDAGEQDVLQYIVWRRPTAGTAWADPLTVMRAVAGTASYSVAIAGNAANTAFTYGVAAQDCTPNLSTVSTVNLTISP